MFSEIFNKTKNFLLFIYCGGFYLKFDSNMSNAKCKILLVRAPAWLDYPLLADATRGCIASQVCSETISARTTNDNTSMNTYDCSALIFAWLASNQEYLV